MNGWNYLRVILFVMEIINALTDSILRVLYISTFENMAKDRICEVMSVEFSILVVEIMHIRGSLGNINIQL